MNFHLVYSGPLPASGATPKPEYAKRIRDDIHPQLEYLWQTHTGLQRLRSTAIVPARGQDLALGDTPFARPRDPNVLRDGEVDLCAPIQSGAKAYRPLVRRSLDLNCTLTILFLRKEDPGSLVLQGGDIDNRIKTLLDALTMPKPEVEAKYPQAQDPTYCLMESDSLVAGIDVQTDRLLIPKTVLPNEVHLIIEVEIRVLRLGAWNLCLVGR